MAKLIIDGDEYTYSEPGVEGNRCIKCLQPYPHYEHAVCYWSLGIALIKAVKRIDALEHQVQALTDNQQGKEAF